MAENDDGFASCDEDDDNTENEPTGDPILDNYLTVKKIPNKEARSINTTSHYKYCRVYYAWKVGSSRV
jgi:hypothetical protein